MPVRQLAQCMEADASLAQLSAHAQKLLKLQYIFERAIPSALARHGRVANVKLGRVVIHAESGAVAAKIRQLMPRLTDVFRQAGVQVNEIQVKVQPDPNPRANQTPLAPASLGEKARSGLGALQTRLPPDSPLRSALERFLDRARVKQ